MPLFSFYNPKTAEKLLFSDVFEGIERDKWQENKLNSELKR